MRFDGNPRMILVDESETKKAALKIKQDTVSMLFYLLHDDANCK